MRCFMGMNTHTGINVVVLFGKQSIDTPDIATAESAEIDNPILKLDGENQKTTL